MDQVMWCHFAKLVTSLYVYENSDAKFGPDKLKFVDISEFFLYIDLNFVDKIIQTSHRFLANIEQTLEMSFR